jgi:hypothetical protein
MWVGHSSSTVDTRPLESVANVRHLPDPERRHRVSETPARRRHRLCNQHAKLLRRVCPPDGLAPILAERYERGSVLMTSNLPFSKWEAIFKDAMMTAAAIDRLVHHSVIIELNIPSYRVEHAKKNPYYPISMGLRQVNSRRIHLPPEGRSSDAEEGPPG